MKVTVRIEHDKYHSIKKSFDSLVEAERFVNWARVVETKCALRKWLSAMREEGGAK